MCHCLLVKQCFCRRLAAALLDKQAVAPFSNGVLDNNMGARLTGKTAIVTGGGTGLGMGIAKSSDTEGCSVVIRDGRDGGFSEGGGGEEE